MGIDKGAFHLADNPDLYEVQRGNAFEFIVTGVDNILRANADESDENAYFSNTQEVLKYSVVSAPVPMFSQEPITINRGNSVMKAAGKPTFKDGSIVVNDYIGADTKSALMAWQRLSYDVKNDAVGNMSDYKKTCYLIEYTQDFKKVVRTWVLKGCFITGIDEGDYSVDEFGKKTITATIAYDRAYPEQD